MTWCPSFKKENSQPQLIGCYKAGYPSLNVVTQGNTVEAQDLSTASLLLFQPTAQLSNTSETH